jgi:hypothetical protein
MTTLLSRAFKKASGLPENLQNELAQELLEELEWERKWESSLKNSPEKIDKLALNGAQCRKAQIPSKIPSVPSSSA